MLPTTVLKTCQEWSPDFCPHLFKNFPDLGEGLKKGSFIGLWCVFVCVCVCVCVCV